MPRAQVKETILNAKKIKLYKDENWVNLRFVVDIRLVTDVDEKEKGLFQDKFSSVPSDKLLESHETVSCEFYETCDATAD